jgi:hypothetical protein
MTTLPLAKLLLLIAISLEPRNAHTIFITSNSDNYVWSEPTGSQGWDLHTKGLPCSAEWTNCSRGEAPGGMPETSAMVHHDWAASDIFDLNDGSQVIKQGDNIFYVVDPGAANQRVYTILYPKS